MKRFPYFYLHPFLLGVYPVVALLGHNIVQVYRLDAVRPLLVVVGTTGLLWALFRWIYRDGTRAALATSWWWFVYVAIENIYEMTRKGTLLTGPVRPPVTLSVFGGMTLLGLWRLRKVENPVRVAQFFFTVGLVANFFPISQIVSVDLATFLYPNHARVDVAPPNLPREAYPDIYFIVLDAYAREDILREVFQYDNTPFLNELKDMGFYIPTCNQSNYSKTAFSITSTLNFNYLDVLGGGNAEDALQNKRLLPDNEVRRLLTEWGYQTIAFPTGYVWSEIRNADLFLTPEKAPGPALGAWRPFGPLNPFESLLLRHPYRPVVDALNAAGVLNLPTENLDTALQADVYQQHYARIQFALSALETIPDLPGPKFVYAHIVSPHPPLVLDREGNFAHTPDTSKTGYTDAITYLNTRMGPILRGILARSAVPPIIILEGDHGAKAVEWTPDVMKNLSAYYFPDGGNERLYNTITPLNAMRVLFDTYFGTDFSLVEDLSYNSRSDAHQLDVELVENTCGE